MQSRFTRILHRLLHPVVALGGAAVIALIAVGIALQMGSVAPAGHYTAVVVEPITGVGGGSSDLSFQVSGQIAAIPVSIGQQVSAGAALVSLDRAALLAMHAGAAANQEAAQARLAALVAGTRPEQLSVNQAAVAQSRESLLDAVRSAYIAADDAIHDKTDQFFTNPRTSSATLAFIVPDQMLENSVQAERVALEAVLRAWSIQVNASAFATSDPLADAKIAQADLEQVSIFLNDVAMALAETVSSSALPLATLQGYQTSVNAARLSVSSSMTAVTNATTALQGAQGVLTIAQAGATTNDIAAAQAIVDAARASLASIDVSLQQSVLVAPVAGTITALNAHLGQTVAPGQIIVSIESSGWSKADALVVPKSSVIEDGGQAFVYAEGKGKTIVTLGLVNADSAEIVSGLIAGDKVLTFGSSIK